MAFRLSLRGPEDRGNLKKIKERLFPGVYPERSRKVRSDTQENRKTLRTSVQLRSSWAPVWPHGCCWI